MSGHTGDMSGHTGDMSGHTGDMSGHTGDMSGHTGDMSGHTGDMSGHTGDMICQVTLVILYVGKNYFYNHSYYNSTFLSLLLVKCLIDQIH